MDVLLWIIGIVAVVFGIAAILHEWKNCGRDSWTGIVPIAMLAILAVLALVQGMPFTSMIEGIALSVLLAIVEIAGIILFATERAFLSLTSIVLSWATVMITIILNFQTIS